MKRTLASSLFLTFLGLGLFQSQASAQAVTVTWPLTSSTAVTSSAPALVTGSAEGFSGGTAPTVAIFDYWSGAGQRLNAGFTGWLPGPASMTRYLQFDASPTAGHQLTVTNVSFNYGGSNNPNQIRANVLYSTNNWSTWTTLATALNYPPHSMSAYTASVSIPPIPAGGKFSLRILPYAIIPSNAGTPTFAAHNSVVINGSSSTSSVPQVRLHLTKSTGSTVVPGTYAFTITCIGPGGPYTGPNPVNVPLPGPGVDAQVPQGDTCQVAEAPTSGWGTPTWGGSSAPIVPNGWAAKIGPMPVNTTMTVTNHPPVAVPQVRLHLTKSTGSNVVPGNYSFHIACTGPGGPYTGPNPVNVPLPGPAIDAQVPQGDTCTLTETAIAGWGNPIWGGSNAAVSPNGWSAQVGPMPVNTTLTVTNQPHPTGGAVNFKITKQFMGTVVPGTYTIHISCTGGYTGPSTVSFVVPPNPSAAAAINVPVGATCQFTENPVSGWQTPLFGGSGQPINPNLNWGATVGPFHATPTGTDQMQVTNRH